MVALPDIAYNILDSLRFKVDEPMLFSSGTFWALFLVFMPLYGMVKNRKWQMMLFVSLFSIFFYYKSSGLYVLLLLGTSLFDWFLSRTISSDGCPPLVRKICVALSLSSSLGILACFKYADFFMWNVSTLIGSNFSPMNLVLPVGISFYTFQSISYVIDVYKGRIAPTRSWLEYMFFLSFFPALVAGPIVRADYFLPQIHSSHKASKSEIYTGLWLIMLGVIKKAVVADYIAQYNDLIFNSPGSYSGFETVMGILGYSMQIYCDFSGYSDMAIGIALIMGFKLAKNFDFPYKSQNITEFWRRWHISLSSWLRDYVYIPLGGNRKGRARTYINSLITMLIGGLWHGAAWKFIFWGGMHGAGLTIHKASSPLLKRLPSHWTIQILSGILTFSFVCFLWVFFRADSWTAATVLLKTALTDFSFNYAPAFISARMLWLIMICTISIAHFLPAGFWDKAQAAFVKSPWLVKLLIFIVTVQLVIELRTADVAPFIYFQF